MTRSKFAGMALALMGVWQSGCTDVHFTWDPGQAALDGATYKMDEDAYKNYGLSQRDAERRADEDEFFDQMQNKP